MKPAIRVHFQLTWDEDQITPEEISNHLGITPSKTWLTGDSIRGTGLRRKHNGWSLSTKRCRTYDLDEQIILLMVKILPKSREITQLIKKYNLIGEVACHVDVVDVTPSINFKPDLLSQLAGLGVYLDINLVIHDS